MKKSLLLLAITATLSVNAQKNSSEVGGVMRNYAIKFAPFQLIAGEFNFSYEQRVAKRISLDLELGPTISQFGLNFGNQKIWQGNSGLDLFNFNSISYNASSGVGFFAGIGPRIYPTSDEYSLKGFYFSPEVKYRLYNYSLKDYNGNLENTKASLDQLIFRFNMGIQFWPKAANFVLDMYFGVGLSTFNIRGKNIEYSNIPDANGFNQTYWDSYRDNGVRFNAITGLRLGFGK
jgi:hypothetical protein